MALNINGTTGISGVDGSASAPALTGTDSNTGINFGSDILAFNVGGSEKARFHSNGKCGIGITAPNALLHVNEIMQVSIFNYQTLLMQTILQLLVLILHLT